MMKIYDSPDQHPYAKSKICPVCGSTFTCGNAQGTCWCNAYPPLEKINPSMDCFCPECLLKSITKND